MMISILTYGSRGDVQPFLALALELKRAGHQVTLAAPHRFDSFVSAHNISFVPLTGDPEVISQRLNDAGTNPVDMVKAMSAYIFSIAGQVAREAFDACEQAELMIHSFLFTTGAHAMARKLRIPDISVQTFPIFAPTRRFPPVSMPKLPPGPLSYFFHWLSMQIFWQGGTVGFRRLRKTNPMAFDLELHWPFKGDRDRVRTPLLLAYSPTVVPRPDDWTDPQIHIPGYFFLELPQSYQPPLELINFLSAGEPPVCVSFGSMIHQDTERIYRIVFETLRKTGNRAVVLSGWGNLSRKQSANTLVLDDIPHSWLLPRCKAVIHHGGAGTTAAGLHAGIPNLVIPFAADQPFWGARVNAIGAGPQPIPVKKLTVEKLILALAEAEEDAIRSGAQVAGKKIRAENGLKVAVGLIEEYAAHEGKSYR